METLWDARFAQRTQRMTSSAIREILKLTAMPDIISFGGGLPAPEVFPVEEFEQACQKVLQESGAEALQYSITEGYPPLRQWICDQSKSIGITTQPANILMTNGSQQALDLLGKILINPGDKIAVEAPTYLGALQAWNAYGAEYVQIETDDDGIIPEALEEAMRVGPKFVYLLPNFQNPTGKTIPRQRRQKLVHIADQFGVPIVEDDPYGQLRFEGESIEPVIALDSQYRNSGKDGYQGNVIYLSTFSKILAPGIRLAWVIAPEEVIHKLVAAKQGADLHTSTFIQMVSYEVAKTGFLDEHIQTIREVYGRRRNLMLDSLAEFFPQGTAWTTPQGGLFLWVILPLGIDATELLKVAVERKVAFVPGTPFYPNQGGENTMRLNFSNATDEGLVEGMERLGLAVKEMMGKK